MKIHPLDEDGMEDTILIDEIGDDWIHVMGKTEGLIIKLEDDRLTIYYRDPKRDIGEYILRNGEFNKITYNQ